MDIFYFREFVKQMRPGEGYPDAFLQYLANKFSVDIERGCYADFIVYAKTFTAIIKFGESIDLQNIRELSIFYLQEEEASMLSSLLKEIKDYRDEVDFWQ